MKKSIKIVLISFVLITAISTSAQTDPPGIPGGGHATNNDAPPGGGAPIGSGAFIFIALSLTYFNRKMRSDYSVKEN